MAQNSLGQSDCRIFKLTISPEHKNEKAGFFACWYRLMKIKSWLKNIGVHMVSNGCGHSGLMALKLAVSKSNYWNKLFFGELIKIQENEKLLQLLLDGGDKKWVQSFRSRDSKICCISRMSQWIGLIFCILIQIYES